MADFTVTQTDLSDAVTFLDQFLTTSLPEYDFSQGTAARDIAINSLAYAVAFFRKEIADIRNRQTLLKLTEATEDLDQESADELVDEILSDWFLTRKQGRVSTGFVTLKFSRQQIGVITFTSDDIFTKSGLDFTIVGDTVTVQSSDLVRNTDNLGIEFWTTTIQLNSAQVGEEYDIDPGPFAEFPQVSPHLLSVENLEKFEGGDGIETSEEMVERSKTAITVRDLNTIPSAQTVLTDTFSQVIEVSPIGYTDPEMQRDLIDIPRGNTTLSIHRGSMMDWYIKFPVEFSKVYSEAFPGTGGLTVANYTVNDTVITAIQLPDFPIYRLKRLVNKNVTPEVEISFTVLTDDPNFWNSARQNIYLIVGVANLGLTLDLEYDTVTGYAAINEFSQDNRNRIIVADPLPKAAFAMYLSFEIRYYPSATGIADVDAAKLAMQSYIHARTLGENIKVAEIACEFERQFTGNIPQLPFVVVGELLLPNGQVLTMSFTDLVRAPEKYYYDELTPTVLTALFPGDAEPGDKIVVNLADLQVSSRTIRFVADTSDIEINPVQ